MKQKIKDKEAFNVDKYCKAVMRGPRKKRGPKVLSHHIQTKFPWYDDNSRPPMQ